MKWGGGEYVSVVGGRNNRGISRGGDEGEDIQKLDIGRESS